MMSPVMMKITLVGLRWSAMWVTVRTHDHALVQAVLYFTCPCIALNFAVLQMRGMRLLK